MPLRANNEGLKNTMFTKIFIPLCCFICLCCSCNKNEEHINFKSLVNLPVENDKDMDHLPDNYEEKTGTDPDNPDTDNDGLSDYLEVRKYNTNPLKADSDNDGIPDSDWNERREYTYAIAVILDLRPPLINEKHMNDFFQDARLLKQHGDNLYRFEIILYPCARQIINPGNYHPIESEYTAPTYRKNYTQEMKDEARKLTAGAKTDIQAAVTILQKVWECKHIEMDEDLGYGTDLPFDFVYYRDENNEIKHKSLASTTTYDLESIKERVFYAKGMYEHKTRGQCGSTSTIRGAWLRSAGIEEMKILTIPLIYFYDSENVEIKLNKKFYKGMAGFSDDPNDPSIRDHFFNIIRIGGQWLRIDTKLYQGITIFTGNPYIKVLEMHDSSDYYLGEFWNYETWMEKRPFQYISIIEQEAIY